MGVLDAREPPMTDIWVGCFAEVVGGIPIRLNRCAEEDVFRKIIELAESHWVLGLEEEVSFGELGNSLQDFQDPLNWHPVAKKVAHRANKDENT